MTDINLLNYFNRDITENYQPYLDTLKKIKSYCFFNTKTIDSLTLPSNIESLGIQCFSNSSIQTLDLSNCINMLDLEDLSTMKSLTNIVLPPNLKTIKAQCFAGCSLLTKISIPGSMETIGLRAFDTTMKEITIHKPQNSISGAPWGATSATIIWGTADIEYTLTPSDASLYIDGVLITSSPHKTSLVGDIPYTIYHKDYPPVHGVLSNVEIEKTYTINETLTNTDGYKVTISPDQADATIIMSYGDFSIESNYVVVPANTEISYVVKKSGYKTIKNTITPTESQTISITMEISTDEEVNMSYPFDASEYNTFTLDNLIDGSNFIIDETTSAIINGSKSYNISSGKSYGYIEFTTPPEETTVSVTGYVSSENNYDFGAVYVGTAIYQPTYSQCKNKTTDGNGQYLFALSGTSTTSTTPTTYSATLQPNTKYYLNFAYAKDGSGNSGKDRVYITNIQFKSASV